MIDWQCVVLNLRKANHPTRKVAESLGVPRSTLQNVAAGRSREIRCVDAFGVSLRLLDLHAKMCPELHSPDVIGSP